MTRKLTILFLLIVFVIPVALPNTTAAQDDTTVRIAVIPVLDTLPFFIAQETGYFDDEGLAVEFIPVTSGIERDQLIQAGEADGMLTDIPGVGFFNEVRPRLQIVYTSRVSLEDGPIFRILASPGSDRAEPEDLSGVPIGVSEATVIEYLTYRLLEWQDVSDIETTAIPAIPTRFQLLMAGELEAATLPDPLAQAAIEAGATPVIDDSILAEEELSQSVLVFTISFIEDHPDAVRSFLLAWDRAVADLNADTEAYRQLFLERTVVPETVQDTYFIPPFPRGLITSQEVWDDYMDWMLDLEIIEDVPSYEDSVNPDFIPDIDLPDAETIATEEPSDS